MDSANKLEENTASEPEEGGSPPKKTKTDCLMHEIENRNAVGVESLIRQGVDVRITGNFSLSEQQKYVNVPPLFAAIILDLPKIVDTLVMEYHHFYLEETADDSQQDSFSLPNDSDKEKNSNNLQQDSVNPPTNSDQEKKTNDSLQESVNIPTYTEKEQKEHANCSLQDSVNLPTNSEKKQQIDVMDLVGAACVFRGSHGVQNHGLSCWEVAIDMRADNDIPKIILPQSKLEDIVFRRSEVVSSACLIKLRSQNPMDWMCEAFIKSHRILKESGRFPSPPFKTGKFGA
ncbi:hypothetical protein DAPPUDRAFT_258213 [Daphnia pulex]|uniref:Uncharacterized protein n=1 Tax=Daphnia pulex TaxID=6669 RepID=E9HEZ4_DAPPU|nr:hypothetical protein DAPPUDRAFT_258213 [Daphnia pulex]|eukprot:EFX69680.1 hypothetical protein DAPPUDRAFT_258213 [Daphnia pulex]